MLLPRCLSGFLPAQVELWPLREQYDSFFTFLPVQNALIVSFVIFGWTIMFAGLEWAWARSRAREDRLSQSLAQSVVEMKARGYRDHQAGFGLPFASSQTLLRAAPHTSRASGAFVQAEERARIKAEAATVKQQGEFRAMVRVHESQSAPVCSSFCRAAHAAASQSSGLCKAAACFLAFELRRAAPLSSPTRLARCRYRMSCGLR